MKVIGLLGGVASGKSLVASQLEKLGAGRLDADAIGHKVLNLPHVQEQIRQRWGTQVFTPTGDVDRRRIARLVFATTPEGAEELVALEQMTHPEITRKLQAEIELWSAEARYPAAVLDAAVMVKGGWHKLCTQVWFIDTPRHLRLERARSRGWNDDELDRREAAQESLDLKRQLAHVIIDNSGTSAATWAQVSHHWQCLLSDP